MIGFAWIIWCGRGKRRGGCHFPGSLTLGQWKETFLLPSQLQDEVCLGAALSRSLPTASRALGGILLRPTQREARALVTSSRSSKIQRWSSLTWLLHSMGRNEALIKQVFQTLFFLEFYTKKQFLCIKSKTKITKESITSNGKPLNIQKTGAANWWCENDIHALKEKPDYFVTGSEVSDLTIPRRDIVNERKTITIAKAKYRH